jgi:hypothetical protein
VGFSTLTLLPLPGGWANRSERVEKAPDREKTATKLPWAIAWPCLLFQVLCGVLGTWAGISHDRCVCGEDPGYVLWAATEHTSRSALALTLLIWAIMPGSSGPTGGAAHFD